MAVPTAAMSTMASIHTQYTLAGAGWLAIRIGTVPMLASSEKITTGLPCSAKYGTTTRTTVRPT